VESSSSVGKGGGRGRSSLVMLESHGYRVMVESCFEFELRLSLTPSKARLVFCGLRVRRCCICGMLSGSGDGLR
jgi:hypothetical protein